MAFPQAGSLWRCRAFQRGNHRNRAALHVDRRYAGAAQHGGTGLRAAARFPDADRSGHGARPVSRRRLPVRTARGRAGRFRAASVAPRTGYGVQARVKTFRSEKRDPAVPALLPPGAPIRRYIDRLFPSAYAFPTIPKGVFPDAPTNKVRLLPAGGPNTRAYAAG